MFILDFELLSQYQYITSLSLSNNRLQSLPNEFKNLKSISVLSLHNNRF